MIEMSSTARTLVGSDIATIRVSVADERDRDRAVALGGLGRDQVDRPEVDVEGAQVEVVEAEALGGRPRELVGRDHLLGEQHLLRSAAAVARLGDGGLDAVARREAELDDVVGDEAPDPPRRLGEVSPGRAPAGPAGKALESCRRRPRDRPRSGSARSARARHRPPAAPLTVAHGSSPLAGSLGTGLRTGVCVSVSLRPLRHVA